MRYDAYLNETTGLNYLDDPPQIGGFGFPATGKTYVLIALANQYPASLTFDPQSRAGTILDEQLEKMGAKILLKDWGLFQMGYSKKENFKINANELHPRIVIQLARTLKKKDEKMRNAFIQFFKKSKTYKSSDRSFEYLKSCFVKEKIESIFEDEIALILHPTDKATISLKNLNESKTIIDISDLSMQSNLPGLIIDSIIGWRKDEVFPTTPLLIQMDEAQQYAASQTMTGRSIAECATRARKFGISTSVFGTDYGALQKQTRQSLKIFFIFKNNFDPNDLAKEFGLNITKEAIAKIPFGDKKEKKGFCLFFNKNEEQVSGKLIRANLYYLTLIKKVSTTPQNTFWQPHGENVFWQPHGKNEFV
jgi:hypothetical protein